MMATPAGHSARCTAVEEGLETDGTRRKVSASVCALENIPFVLLMRHARHVADKASPLIPPNDVARSKRRPRKLSNKGKRETQEVAERLKEHFGESWVEGPIKNPWEQYQVAAIIAADTDEASATAEIVRDVLQLERLKAEDQAMLEVKLLEPRAAFSSDSFKDCGALGFVQELKTDIARVARRLSATGQKGNAILIVGHQPILGWLGHGLVHEAHPLGHSEVLCLDLRDKVAPRGLRWAISPSDPQAVTDLKEKIRSKMEVAKLLSSFLGGGLAFLLGTMADKDAVTELHGHLWPFAVGSVALLAALGFFLWTMCSYDALLMPNRMWAETPRGTTSAPAWLVERPPSGVHWILFQNMMRIWQWQFLPATGLMLAGLWMLASAVFLAGLCRLPCVATDYYSVLAVIAVAVIARKGSEHRQDFRSAAACPGLTSKIRHLCGPWLGSED